jgi:hypothetical protein
MQQQMQQTLARWHAMLEQGNFEQVESLLAEDVVFRSPVAYQPYSGKAVVAFILQNVIQIFQDFRYHRELHSQDGRHVVLEFSARVGDKTLKGIDMISIDSQGKIIDFEVMLRPKSGLEALAAQMGKRMQAYSAPS